jgi:ribulose kinase
LTILSQKLVSVASPGKHIGFLSRNAGKDLGLVTSTDELKEECIPISIGSAIIDAHSGVLAMLTFSAELKETCDSNLDFDSIFCLIAGTSTCHFVSNRERHFTKGVWGPYYNVILPNYYVREAGQSLTGKLIEHIICTHSEYQNKYKNIPIEDVIKELNSQISSNKYNKNKLHINPCFHGNRSPLANPFLRGIQSIKSDNIYQLFTNFYIIFL